MPYVLMNGAGKMRDEQYSRYVDAFNARAAIRAETGVFLMVVEVK